MRPRTAFSFLEPRIRKASRRRPTLRKLSQKIRQLLVLEGPPVGSHDGHDYLVAPLEKVGADPMPPIETHRKGRLELAHPRYQIGLLRFERKVIVIVYQHQRVDPPARSLARLAGKKSEARRVFP